MRNSVFISAIKNKEVLSCTYEGEQRTLEPQTYGITVAGNRALRARQIGGGSRSGQPRIAKLFVLSKISGLKKTGAHFREGRTDRADKRRRCRPAARRQVGRLRMGIWIGVKRFSRIPTPRAGLGP